MSLLWTDGIDRYSANADLALNYTLQNTPTWSATGGVFSNNAYIQVSTNQGVTRTFPTAGTITAGNGVHESVWLKWTTLPGSLDDALYFGTDQQATNGSNPARIKIDNNGALHAYMHGANTDLSASPNGTIVINTWYHCEYAAKYNTSGNGGYIKFWVDGNLVINFSGTTNSGTVPTTYTGMRFAPGGTQTFRFASLFCWDENGTDFALTQASTAYLPVIETLAVDADDTVQFTPLSSTNKSNIDETGFHDGDTSYNSSATVGQEDLFTVANQTSTPAYVFGVAVKTVWKIDIAGTINMRDKLNSGATTSYSADRLMTTSYVLAASFYGKDPDTGPAVWTVSAPDSIKIGYKYQS